MGKNLFSHSRNPFLRLIGTFTRISIGQNNEMDGAIQYFDHLNRANAHQVLRLSSIMKKMRYLNDILHGMEPTEEFKKKTYSPVRLPVPPSPLLMRVTVLDNEMDRKTTS